MVNLRYVKHRQTSDFSQIWFSYVVYVNPRIIFSQQLRFPPELHEATIEEKAFTEQNYFKRLSELIDILPNKSPLCGAQRCFLTLDRYLILYRAAGRLGKLMLLFSLNLDWSLISSKKKPVLLELRTATPFPTPSLHQVYSVRKGYEALCYPPPVIYLLLPTSLLAKVQ